MGGQNRSPGVRTFVANAATAAAYLAGGWIAFVLNLPGEVASPVWPPSGLMLAAVLLFGRSVLPGVALGAAAFDLSAYPDAGLLTWTLDTAGATLEPLVASLVIRAGSGGELFADWRHSVRFLGGACAGAVMAALLGVAAFVAGGMIAPAATFAAFTTWWAGNLAASLSLAPLLVLWATRPPFAVLAARPWEALLVLAVLPALGGLLFALHLAPVSGPGVQTLEVLAVPTLVLAAYRFHAAGAAVAVFICSAAAIATTEWTAAGPAGVGDSLLQLQLFLATSGGLTVLLASERADRLRALARAREAQRAAEEANRAKTAFLANMSHELRTPLNAVIGFSDMMNNRVFGPLGHPKYEEYAGHIASSGTYLLKLISDILDMTKVESGSVEMSCGDVAVGELLREAAVMVAPRAAQAGVAVVDGIRDDLHFHVDRRFALQVAVNLVCNAVKFTPRGGVVRLETVADGEQAGFRIGDTGIGIAPEHLPLVLQPFCQLRPADLKGNEGVGLGLPMAKRLVELHGGRFEIHSTPGQGTTVTALFPAAREAAAVG